MKVKFLGVACIVRMVQKTVNQSITQSVNPGEQTEVNEISDGIDLSQSEGVWSWKNSEV